jgi:hypothetical protein
LPTNFIFKMPLEEGNRLFRGKSTRIVEQFSSQERDAIPKKVMTKHLPPSRPRDCHTAAAVAAAGGTGQEGDGKKSPWSPRITRLPINIRDVYRLTQAAGSSTEHGQSGREENRLKEEAESISGELNWVSFSPCK